MEKSSPRSAISRKPPDVRIERLSIRDRPAWLEMRAALWPTEDRAELGREIRRLLMRDDFAAFGVRNGDGTWLGLVEVNFRDVAEGCVTSPVAYVEGLWVDRSVRRQGIARRLVETAAQWGRSHGLRELASDTNLGNRVSQAMHLKLGFTETDRLVTYRKVLRPRR